MIFALNPRYVLITGDITDRGDSWDRFVRDDEAMCTSGYRDDRAREPRPCWCARPRGRVSLHSGANSKCSVQTRRISNGVRHPTRPPPTGASDRRGGCGAERPSTDERQHRADRPDPIRRTMIVDEADHHFGRRSSSAWAKYGGLHKILIRAPLLAIVALRVLQPLTLVRRQAARSPRSRSAWRTPVPTVPCELSCTNGILMQVR
jgi:hypothetical protein